MLTIHDRIEEFLAADLHNELSESEREELHTHLMECAGCRDLHKQEQVINKALQGTLEHSKPLFGFEQRILGAFRNRVPYRKRNVGSFFLNATRSRAAQLAGAAIVLLTLFEIGQHVTGETNENPWRTLFVSRKPPAARATAAAAAAQSSWTAHAQVFAANESTNPTAPSPTAAPILAADPVASPKATVANTPVAVESSPGESTREDNTARANAPEDATANAATAQATPAPLIGGNDERKLIRNASLDLEVRSFDDALQSITDLAKAAGGYIATNSSEKQENGKLRGEIVVKVLPDNLDDFLGKLRGLGELKNQTLATQDVSKQYLDTDARLRNARVVEQRLVDMLEKNSGRVSDLLQVEKELGRVREQIEQMEGELKFMESQVQFATVTIRLAEKDMGAPAGFLIKERVQLALFVPEVEKVYATIRGFASDVVQISNAALDHDASGRVSARISMLVAPEESDNVIAKIRAMGRVTNFQVQSQRVARGGQGMAADAKTEWDKVELNITISREDDEPARQQTSLSVRAADVNGATKQLGAIAQTGQGKIRSSTFSRHPNGAEFSSVSLRIPLKNYNAVMQSLASLGKLENITVHREDRPGDVSDEQSAPADVTVTVYSQGNIVAPETGLSATLRRTLTQSAAALMWSLRMVGVALASVAPWALLVAIAFAVIIAVRRFLRARAG
ncbi:MAG: DUF4349 domain-containing protein [Verrucomicrobia bacterium]|nr:DUF4349 domain-containing protein [Verrucomicrobiota bacterium]